MNELQSLKQLLLAMENKKHYHNELEKAKVDIARRRLDLKPKKRITSIILGLLDSRVCLVMA